MRWAHLIKWLIFVLNHENPEYGLCVFYNILDQADINSMVLFKLARKQEKTIRRKFLNELGLHFAQPHMKRRPNKKLPGELGKYIEDMLHEKLEKQKPSALEPPKKMFKISRCYMCP